MSSSLPYFQRSVSRSMCFIPRLLCRVEWYTGDVTKEIITGETDEMYIFDYKKNHSYSAPKQWCEVLNVV